MPIRIRLFLLIAMLVLALVGMQWWLGNRQIQRAQDDMVAIASTVSHKLITEVGGDPPLGAPVTYTRVVPPPRGAAPAVGPGPATPFATPGNGRRVFVLTASLDGTVSRAGQNDTANGTGALGQAPAGVAGGACTVVDDLSVELERMPDGADGCLVLRRGIAERRIVLPLAAAARRARATLRQSVLLGGGLLAVGLIAAAAIAHRVTGPLRQLAAGVEEVGRGGFQARVAVTDSGEVGDLQRSFNAMAERLDALERERDAWREREHLAQLGDLARGLAHTLRNPLNTLGLAVEELAGRGGAGEAGLVATARAQIRRVDRWLLSFLALGAGRGAAAQTVDLVEQGREAVFEAVQTGARVELVAPPGSVLVRAVPGALRAAVQSLVENAVAASPADEVVTVTVAQEGDCAVLRVEDRGPGLPAEVRERLFSPHVTTKPGGAGMGLFLARQLVETGLGGGLELAAREGGGTSAVISLGAPEPRDGAAVS